MTEDEAKTKACPMAATFGGSQQLADGPGPNCIGSACMAWRKVSTIVDRSTGAPPLPGHTYKYGSTEERYLGNGFCGLAGAPL